MRTIHIQTLGWCSGREIRDAISQAQMEAYERKMADYRMYGQTWPVKRWATETASGAVIHVTTEVE